MSRTLIAAPFFSVDGAASNPNEFQYDFFDEGLGAFMTRTLERIDEVILGRVTYEMWAPYWSTFSSDGPDQAYADFINSATKHVVSRTLAPEDLTWSGSRLVEGELLDYVRALKETEGGAIGVQGSMSVIRQLVEAGLVDELTLIVHPAIAGASGCGLFEGAAPTRLRLLSVETTEKGNILATYGPFKD